MSIVKFLLTFCFFYFEGYYFSIWKYYVISVFSLVLATTKSVVIVIFIPTFLEWMIVFGDSTLWGMGLIENSYFFYFTYQKKTLPNGLLECLSEISFYCHMLVLCDRFFWKHATDTPMYPRYETRGFQKNNHNKILLAEPMIFS